jgi:hypothetical protein
LNWSLKMQAKDGNAWQFNRRSSPSPQLYIRIALGL